MAINLPNGNLPAGDLARTVNHEMNQDWPSSIEIVAYFGEGRRKSKRIVITAEQFYGTGGGFNAPITGDQLVGLIERLRRQR